jgi:hypothetical protein
MKAVKWMVALVAVAGAMNAQAAPWLGLVKTGSSQTNDTISLAQVSVPYS